MYSRHQVCRSILVARVELTDEETVSPSTSSIFTILLAISTATKSSNAGCQTRLQQWTDELLLPDLIFTGRHESTAASADAPEETTNRWWWWIRVCWRRLHPRYDSLHADSPSVFHQCCQVPRKMPSIVFTWIVQQAICASKVTLSVHYQQATTTFSFSSLFDNVRYSLLWLPLPNCHLTTVNRHYYCTTVCLLCYDSVQNLGKTTLRATCLVYLLFTANVTCGCKVQTSPLYQYHLTLISFWLLIWFRRNVILLHR